MSDVGTRPAEPRDIEVIFELAARESVGEVQRWVETGAARVATRDDRVIGFAVTESSFFRNDFLELLHISPSDRRLGAATRLLADVSAARKQPKLFTSTNLSNTAMQGVLAKLNWESVGIVYGLDDGDPELFFRAPAL